MLEEDVCLFESLRVLIVVFVDNFYELVVFRHHHQDHGEYDIRTGLFFRLHCSDCAFWFLIVSFDTMKCTFSTIFTPFCLP